MGRVVAVGGREWDYRSYHACGGTCSAPQRMHFQVVTRMSRASPAWPALVATAGQGLQSFNVIRVELRPCLSHPNMSWCPRGALLEDAPVPTHYPLDLVSTLCIPTRNSEQPEDPHGVCKFIPRGHYYPDTVYGRSQCSWLENP